MGARIAGLACAGVLGGCTLPECGYDLAGISLQLPSGTTTTLRVGESIIVTARVDRPVDLACPDSPTNRQSHFRRVKWSWKTDGPLEVRPVACPCALGGSYQKEGRTFSVTTASGPGVFSFEITGRVPGQDYFAIVGLIEAGWTGACPFLPPGDPRAECGLFVWDTRVFRVIE